MLLKVYTIYYSGVEAYLQPFFMAANGAAIRGFSEIVNDPTHQFAKHPGDYTLFELGTYDDITAKFEMLPSPKSLGVGVEFVRPSTV